MVHLDRRHFLQRSLSMAGLGLLSGCGIPIGTTASPARLPRIGFLAPGTLATSGNGIEIFRQGLGEHGYVEGQNINLEPRFADGGEEPLATLTDELVHLPVDVIVTAGSSAIRTASQAIATIPIAFTILGGDPVAKGFVSSLARPGGNVTGFTSSAGQENAKWPDLLKEGVPRLSRLAVLWATSAPGGFGDTVAAAQALGIEVLSWSSETRKNSTRFWPPLPLAALMDSASWRATSCSRSHRGLWPSRPRPGCQPPTPTSAVRQLGDSWSTLRTFRRTRVAQRPTSTRFSREPIPLICRSNGPRSCAS